MSGPSTYEPKTGIEKWLDTRLPIIRFGADLMDFPTPKNLNYWWTFGGILAACLAIQIVTGIVLAMHYVANTQMAFASVERIMRDVDFGWLIRNIHANGASMFFLAVYIHMFRGMYYGSYKSPREVIWILGVVIYLLMMATAFMGYVLPWGQMSFHGAVVITNLFGALPLVGESITTWLWGGFAVDNPTLNQMLTNFGTSANWDGAYLSNNMLRTRRMQILSTGAYTLFDNAQQIGTGTVQLVSWPDYATSISFRLCNPVCGGTAIQLAAPFSMFTARNGPPEAPDIEYYLQ